MARLKNHKRGVIFLCIIIVIIGAIPIFILKGQDMVEYKLNPNLACIKADWKGNVVIDGKYQNDTIFDSAPFFDVIKWKFSKNPQRKEKKAELYSLSVEYIDSFENSEDIIIWLGHSTFFIQIDGVRIITDPVFGDIPTSKRKVRLPCSIDSLRNIDYLLISHDHHDHFNKKSIGQLSNNNPAMQALVPLDARRLFKNRQLKNISLQEAGWYQEYKTGKNIRIIFLPAIHWGRRSLNDYNKTLWGSFLIIGKHKTIFFAGDSAYGEIFKDIQTLFPHIDICMLPIAAYSPKFMMKSSHMNPEEAMGTFQDLNGKILIPMHYGTFDLSDEPMGEPINRLRAAALNSEQTDNLVELPIGRKYYINYKRNDTE